MRIALVTPHATPPDPTTQAGRGPHLIPLAQAVAGAGHDVHVYARKDSPALPRTLEVPPHVRIDHVTAGPAGWLPPDDLVPYVRAFGDYLAKRWRDDTPDVVHAYSWPSGLAAFATARELDIPLVLTFHSLAGPAGKYPHWQPREPLARLKLKVSLARNVQAVIARSSEEMRRLVRLGVPRASIKIVPWGVDTSHFVPEGPVAERSERPRLLAFLPPDGHPGIEVVLRALVDVPGAELVLVGGPEQAGGQRSQRTGEKHGARRSASRDERTVDKLQRDLARLAGRFKLTDRVSFLSDVSWDDLPALLRSADLLLTTETDGVFDETALQAMACGTPVVAPAEGFYPDAVIDGTTGLLVPAGQPAVLAMRIRRLLASSLQLEAFGIAAADRARSRYAWDRIGRETTLAYERCVTHPLEPVDAAAEQADEEEAEFLEAAG
jgi:D-inositol-3-phosphate glycosyltransferase